MHRFLLRPRWIAFSALILLVIAGCLAAARWQWHRYEYKRGLIEQFEQRQAEPPAAFADLVPPGADASGSADREWRTVTASGSYHAEETVLVRNRSLDGAPGYHVVTPLVLADGRAVLINRGFIPFGTTDALPTPPAPPTGTVTVTGRLRPSQERGSFGPRDPATGRLDAAVRVDIERLAPQMAEPLAPDYVEATSEQPPVSPAPTFLPPPELDEGPHRGYAGQWVIFAICAAVGWWIVVRRKARSLAA